MLITLKNSRFEAALNTVGAEINSFKDANTGASYIWDGPASVWKFHAPVLFPHVGRILGGEVEIDGKKCELKVNGFSRDMEHRLVSQTETSAEFELTESPETQSKFPWKFSLRTFYQLTDEGLTFRTTVTNTDSRTISFSLGSHSAFCCPRNTDPAGTKNSDYQIEFEKREPLTAVACNEDGYLACDGEGTAPFTRPYGEREAGIIPLDDKGFGKGHFFTAFTSDWVGLRNKKDGSLVKVNTKGYPYLMIWQNDGEPAFVCIEPWYGTPDPENADGTWDSKPALLSLEPGASFTADQSISIQN